MQSYRADLDGLRALAVLAIVGYHAFPSLVRGGFVGVDIFFVISGFLITGIIARDCDAKRFSWGGFYLRRARRILPALVVVSLITAGLAAWIVIPRQLIATGIALLASAWFGANLMFAQTQGYFAPSAQQNPFLHLWSLGVEEQFYLVWPFLIATCSLRVIRPSRPWIVVGLLAISLVSAQALIVTGAANTAFFSLFTRAWEFLVGGVLSLGLIRPPAGAREAAAAGVVGLVLLGADIVFLDDSLPFPGVAAVPACLGVALIIWSGQGQTPRVTAILRSSPAVAIGQISYSLYLWHWPLLVLGADFALRPLAPMEKIGLMIAAAALAAVTWRYVEQPARRGPIDRPWSRLAPFSAGLLMLFGAGAVFAFTGGLPGRLSPAALEAAAIEGRDINPLRQTCFGHAGPIAAEGCRIGASAVAKDYDVLVWGDSHADAITPGVVVWAQRRGFSVREATQGGCPPLVGVRVHLLSGYPLNCEASTKEVMREIAENPKLKFVVLAARWPLYRDQPPLYDLNSPRVKMEAITAPGKRPPLSRVLDATLTAIEAANSRARIVIIGPVPELTFLPPECIAQARHLHRREQDCWTAPSGPPLTRARPAEAQIRLALATHPKAHATFPTRELCTARICFTTLDGRLIYFDDDHLSASGARKLVPRWMDRLTPQ